MRLRRNGNFNRKWTQMDTNQSKIGVYLRALAVKKPVLFGSQSKGIFAGR
jgi:hypothetical protein